MNSYKIDFGTSACTSTIDVPYPFLPSEYNFILFFSLPFYPLSKMYKKKVLVFGHLSLALGNTVYQLHDPEKLRSSFLVSRMPVEEWLFRDGAWYDWDTASPTYRHVHLYEKAEVKRTVVFFAALKNFPAERLVLYERYLERIERTFQKDHFRFNRIFNNCTRVINNILYRERWLRKGPLDFVPAIAFKRLVAAWKRCDVPFCAGHFSENNPAYFRVHPVCFGLLSLSPDQNLARWIAHRGDPAKKRNSGQENTFVFSHWRQHEAGRNTKTAGM